ncbi:MAG: septum formation family protein [Micromonosporaceae bacterium]|jgi:hypothetical protein
MPHPQELPPYRYGPEQPSGSAPPADRSPSDPDAPGSSGPAAPAPPGSWEGSYVSGRHPTGATGTHQPDTPQPQTQQPQTQQPGTQLPDGRQPGGERPGGQQPHPQVPQPAGGPPGYGYPPGQPGGSYGHPEPRTNPFAVASLVLGILTPVGYLPGLLALIFGIIALVQIPERGQKGRGLAIGGLAATGGWLVVTLAVAIGFASIYESDDGDQARTATDRTTVTDDGSGDDRHRTPVNQVERGRSTPVYRLRDGMCVKELPTGEGPIETMRVVDCDVPHVAEVYALFNLSHAHWPGDDVVDAEAADGCHERLQQDHPDAWDDPAVEVFYLFPSGVSWGFGDRGVVCIAEYLDGTRTGSLFDTVGSTSGVDDSTPRIDERPRAGRISVYRLEPGHCVESLPDQDEFSSLLAVDCERPHEAEVYALFDLSHADWPGDDVAYREADEGCHERLRHHRDAWVDPGVDLFFLYPSEATWADGDRQVVCLAQYMDGARTGSLFD